MSDRAGLRVGIAAQTRDQATEIARRLGGLTSTARLIWTAKGTPPDLSGSAAAVVTGRAVRFPPSGGGVLVATTARWTYADPRTLGCDVMVVDEAWQATYADLGALGAFAPQVVCVGDPGQIAPVVTGQTRRWANSPTGPHLPATTQLIQPTFYPALPFTSKRPPEHLSTPHGHPLPEVTHLAVTVTSGSGDPALTGTCADRARDLLTHTLNTTAGSRPLTPADVAVVCAHVSQAAAVRAMLADLPDLLVGTANQLQGMERHAAVVLHPLAGYREPNAFGTDLGRACVMLSRHRAHLSVVTDTATPPVLTAPDTEDAAATTHRHLLDALLATPPF